WSTIASSRKPSSTWAACRHSGYPSPLPARTPSLSDPRMIKTLKFFAPGPRIGFGLGGLLALVALWAVGSHWLQGSMSMAALLGPQEAFKSLYELLVQNQLTLHTIVSLKRVLVGLGLALLLGVPIGLAVGSSRALENCTSSAFQFLRMISPLSWMPIAVMVFG